MNTETSDSLSNSRRTQRVGRTFFDAARRTTLFVLLFMACATTRAAQPNIVFVLADDLGWSDLQCYGSDLHETPHLDELAASGMRFTQAYAPAPVCTPTRASILTGKHPARLHMTIWSEGSLKGPTDRKLTQADSLHDLPLSEVTLGEHLQKAGYITAHVGKWHLGDANHAPETQGFDINIGGTHWGAPQTFFWPYRGSGRFGNEFRYVPHLDYGRPGEYLTDRLTDDALRVIDHAHGEHKPFCLFLNHHAPHTPIEAKPEDIEYFESKLKPSLRHKHPVYAAMIRSLDQSVGRVMQRLQELSMDDQTIFIFTSDNGGYIGQSAHRGQPLTITSNWPLRSGKGSLYEGGLRVPLIVRWPGKTPGVGAVSHEPVWLTDWFPTLLTYLHIELPQPLDGIDISSVLASPDSKLPRDEFFFHYPHYYHAPATTPCGAMRRGNYKLIEWFEDNKIELYDLATDPGEEHDVAAQQPNVAQAMKNKLHQWREEVGANMCRPK